jgi:integrase
MKLHDFFESNYRIRKLRGKSPNTVRLYRFSVRNFSRVIGKDAELDDLTDDNVALTMQAMLDRGCSPYSANKERSQLLALWRYAAKLGLVAKWPTVEAETEPERVPQAWMLDDVTKLMEHIANARGYVGMVPARVWWNALLHICLDTGERIGAVQQARWSWLEDDWLLVPAEARKGRKRDRRYKLSPETCEALAKLKSYCDSDEMLHWPYCASYLWAKYSKLLADAGLPHGPKDKFHRLRKTTCSVAHQAGLNAQELLDHQSRRTTQRYLDPRFTRTEQASDVLAAWLRNPPQPAAKRKAE